MSVLWQGNAISTMKTFGGLNCALCMKERLHILNDLEKDKTSKKNHSLTPLTNYKVLADISRISRGTKFANPLALMRNYLEIPKRATWKL